MRSCRKKTGPGEASLSHSAMISTTGNHKGKLIRIQVRSRMVFQAGTGEAAAVVMPLANCCSLTDPLSGKECSMSWPIGVLAIEGLLSRSVTILCGQDAVSSIIIIQGGL